MTRTDRVRGMGDFLVEVHTWLRGELDGLLTQVDAVADGRAEATLSLSADLRAHCLSFCGALTKHHTGEDMGAFPMLARQFPEMAPALHKLGEEHAAVSALQKEIQRLVDSYVPGATDPRDLRTNLRELATKLEAHFDYEERTVVAALNTTPAPY
ncbi:Hemerythrin HHE cation binding domain-containing protein [Amycolatopsis xylanica]|uniref:Hemerythrin HHE cation binding domain-containing protein n=1 Tax=Amycolatopsis xylanica TaxID=589385 RepID=A0A1H3D4J8_9PSEU|nr:hemerythrin domain-containing protein [Amycolatopsis xylanica]SDX61048.1 Hemerythrin HHE cation binding domain-containing protein [Amycolatopsis xylanica]